VNVKGREKGRKNKFDWERTVLLAERDWSWNTLQKHQLNECGERAYGDVIVNPPSPVQ